MKLPVALLATCIICVAASQAQTSTPSSPENQPRMQQDSQPASLASSVNKGGRKLTGCIRSENGKYFLENKTRKKIWLSGPVDFTTHAGHTVVLHGSFLDPSSATKQNNFQVTDMEMVSDTCTLKITKGNHPVN
jgi:poly(3-hydroxybutyrate) depolymerase